MMFGEGPTVVLRLYAIQSSFQRGWPISRRPVIQSVTRISSSVIRERCWRFSSQKEWKGWTAEKDRSYSMSL